MLDKIGGRKAAASLTVLLIGIISVGIKGDIPANLLQLLEVVMGAFVVGNVSSKYINKNIATTEDVTKALDTYIDSKTPTQDNETSIQLANISNGVAFVQELLQLIIRKTGLDKAPEPKQGA